MISRPLSIAILVGAGMAAASQALALGFGRTPESMPFGQPLDIAVPLHLDAGETLAPGCVQAEVHIGEQRLPPGALQAVLEQRGGDWRVRLRSATAVQEPLVAVNLAVGCNGSVSRQFVVFADPPSTLTEAPRLAPIEPLSPVLAQAEPRATSGAAPRPAASKPVRKARAEGARARAPSRANAPAVAVRSPARNAVTPRLKLEEPEELLKAAAAAVAAQDAALASAAQAASAAEAAASAAEQRLTTMEADLKSMRDDATAYRASMELMRQRLAQSEDQGRMQSMLAAVVAALLLLVLWLGWRVRTLQRERQAAWWQGAAAQAAVPPTEPEVPAQPAAAAPALLPDAPDTVPPIAHRTGPLPPAVLVDEPLIRPVSVDELIDLEQQAEFFLVLGEDDAAVDLLMSHLRSSGGTSPLPYLKLLEIYRRRGDRDAYERMRRRFSQRFNAVASEWEVDPEQGRDLQDYPAVLAVLQAAWPQPLDAMTELENLLFRKRSGELFELPAYRDVLALYSVARDLHRQLDQPTHDVDVLLPLGAGEAASPSIFDNLDSSFPADDRPTAPVDLDLSEPTTASSAAPVR